ncbi:hypothetical protein KSP39_PZI000002 [Platanthera zijinensis]|uniref:Uncharacterized protein n=1 Tax=Platanthera zijinensis TaxID=2320716 RepID=A0AAP0GG50_9ASPA
MIYNLDSDKIEEMNKYLLDVINNVPDASREDVQFMGVKGCPEIPVIAEGDEKKKLQERIAAEKETKERADCTKHIADKREEDLRRLEISSFPLVWRPQKKAKVHENRRKKLNALDPERLRWPVFSGQLSAEMQRDVLPPSGLNQLPGWIESSELRDYLALVKDAVVNPHSTFEKETAVLTNKLNMLAELMDNERKIFAEEKVRRIELEKSKSRTMRIGIDKKLCKIKSPVSPPLLRRNEERDASLMMRHVFTRISTWARSRITKFAELLREATGREPQDEFPGKVQIWQPGKIAWLMHQGRMKSTWSR